MTEAALLRVIFGLLFVVGVILACAVLARRLGLAGSLSRHAPLKLVGRLGLGPRAGIVVVEIEQTWLVVGVGATGMTLLHTLPAADTPGAGQVSSTGADFAQKLSSMLKRS